MTRGRWTTLHEQKTPDQLRAEMAYYTRELQTRTCPDRRRRAQTALQAREAALRLAIKVRAGSGV